MPINSVFECQRVLITGGTGSLGKTLVKRLLSGKNGIPEKIIIFSRDEAKQHFMRVEYLNAHSATDEVIYSNFQRKVEFRIGDVRNQDGVDEAVKDATIVINAAALKQVPSCEYFVEESVKTNILGPCNVVRAVGKTQHVHTVIGVSTDKACKPVNAMGMTKAIQEKVFISANIHSNSRFACVRYGNVLASRGSVVPLFHDQIRKGGPVTITSREMTRFLLPLERAVDTIVAAVVYACPGEIFVPVVPSAKVLDVAMAIIGPRKIPVEDVGIRPGEKMHEILVSEEECGRAQCLETEIEGDQYYVVAPALPELNPSYKLGDRTAYDLSGEYSSASLPMSFEQTTKMLEDNELLKVEDEPQGEMLK
jgi:UDP-glucose 4-epimerase